MISCNNSQELEIKANIVENDVIICDKENIHNGLSKEMISIIQEMISLYDSVDFGMSANILNIEFVKKKNDCFISFYEALCYNMWLQYYTFVDDKLIAIYHIEDEWNYDFFDTTNLEKFHGIPLELLLDTTMERSVYRKITDELKKKMTVIEGYPSESFGHFHPIGRSYKIQSKEHLELVYEGRFE